MPSRDPQLSTVGSFASDYSLELFIIIINYAITAGVLPREVLAYRL